jgi:hypothetical protein
MPSEPVNFDLIKDQFLMLLKTEAINFVTGHVEEVQVLGADVVKAILDQQTMQYLPIPPITEGMTDIQINAVEELLTRRDQIFQLVAKAEKEDAIRVAKIKTDAAQVGLKIANWLLGVGLGVLASQI